MCGSLCLQLACRRTLPRGRKLEMDLIPYTSESLTFDQIVDLLLLRAPEAEFHLLDLYLGRPYPGVPTFVGVTWYWADSS